jgi:hypothetical protein
MVQLPQIVLYKRKKFIGIKRSGLASENRTNLSGFLMLFENRTIGQPDKKDHLKTGLVRISDVDCSCYKNWLGPIYTTNFPFVT